MSSRLLLRVVSRLLFRYLFFLSILTLVLTVVIEHDHVLGVSTSVRFNSHLISVWNKLGSNERSIKRLEETILSRLSPELRPTGGGNYSYSYKRHAENEAFRQVEAQKTEPDNNESDTKREVSDDTKD